MDELIYSHENAGFLTSMTVKYAYMTISFVSFPHVKSIFPLGMLVIIGLTTHSSDITCLIAIFKYYRRCQSEPSSVALKLSML